MYLKEGIVFYLSSIIVITKIFYEIIRVYSITLTIQFNYIIIRE